MAAIAQERSAPARFDLRAALRRLWSHFLVRRIAKALFTVFFVSTLIFFLVRLLPGSPVEVFIAQLISQYGYSYEVAASQARSLFAFDPDQPVLLQYFDYLKNLAHGDLGQSLLSPGVPVTEIIFTYLPWTLFSVGLGLLLAFAGGVVLGMVMAYRRNSALDNFLSIVGVAVLFRAELPLRHHGDRLLRHQAGLAADRGHAWHSLLRSAGGAELRIHQGRALSTPRCPS